MNDIEFESAPPPDARPKTTTVLGLLIGLAAIISYLATFAVANAMVAAEVIKPWPKEHDPRPKWFLIGFLSLIAIFSTIGAAVRHVSALHMKKIEAMEEE